jgi:hypothetical protein
MIPARILNQRAEKVMGYCLLCHGKVYDNVRPEKDVICANHVQFLCDHPRYHGETLAQWTDRMIEEGYIGQKTSDNAQEQG